MKLLPPVDGSIITGRPFLLEKDQFTDKLKKKAGALLDSIIADFDFGSIKVKKEVLTGAPFKKYWKQPKKSISI